MKVMPLMKYYLINQLIQLNQEGIFKSVNSKIKKHQKLIIKKKL